LPDRICVAEKNNLSEDRLLSVNLIELLSQFGFASGGSVFVHDTLGNTLINQGYCLLKVIAGSIHINFFYSGVIFTDSSLKSAFLGFVSHTIGFSSPRPLGRCLTFCHEFTSFES